MHTALENKLLCDDGGMRACDPKITCMEVMDKRGKKLIEEITVREEKNAWEGFVATSDTWLSKEQVLKFVNFLGTSF